MPVDPTGTSPGLIPAAREEAPVLNMRCKNPHCDSITAIEVKVPGPSGNHLYRCTKCGHTHGVNLGGAFNF